MIESKFAMTPRVIPIFHSNEFAARLSALQPSAKATESHTRSFPLSKALMVSFESVEGGSVGFSSHRPAAGKPYCTIEPRGMGPSRWFSIELTLDLEQLRHVSQVIPVLEAGAARTVSLFAVLRYVLPNNHILDTSSTQIELRKGRRAYSLPISVGDLPEGSPARATSAKLIFFVEARDVALDLYGLTVVAVGLDDDALVHPDQVTQLRQLALAGDPGVRHASLDASELKPGERLQRHTSLSNGVFRIDIDSENGEFVRVARNEGSLVLDFSGAESARWRSLELRFDSVENSGDLRSLVRFCATADYGEGGGQPIDCTLRYYGDNWDDWIDRAVLEPLDADSSHQERLTQFDISTLLAETGKPHNIGIMCFVPPGCRQLELHGFEVFLYHQRS